MEYILFDLQFFPPAQGRYSVAVNCPLLQGDAVGEFVSPAADPDYAALTLAMRGRETPGDVFDRLVAMGLVTLHADDEHAHEHIAKNARNGDAITVATNDEAAELNERIRTGRIEGGEVDDAVTATGSDGLPIGAGDLIQTRRNDTTLGVANRQQWVGCSRP